MSEFVCASRYRQSFYFIISVYKSHKNNIAVITVDYTVLILHCFFFIHILERFFAVSEDSNLDYPLWGVLPIKLDKLHVTSLLRVAVHSTQKSLYIEAYFKRLYTHYPNI